MSTRRTPIIFAALCVATFLLIPPRAPAFQSFMSKAKKFGAADCLFCHVHEDGGEGWNERGQWLMEQKAERKAEKIDVEWLAEYKPASEEQEKSKASDKKEKPRYSLVSRKRSAGCHFPLRLFRASAR